MSAFIRRWADMVYLTWLAVFRPGLCDELLACAKVEYWRRKGLLR